MSSIARILMASDPAERQWLEDQLTITLHSGRNLTGNASTVVIENPTTGHSVFCTVDQLRAGLTSGSVDVDVLSAAGYRVIDGSALFTPRDRPRAYKAPAK